MSSKPIPKVKTPTACTPFYKVKMKILTKIIGDHYLPECGTINIHDKSPTNRTIQILEPGCNNYECTYEIRKYQMRHADIQDIRARAAYCDIDSEDGTRCDNINVTAFDSAWVYVNLTALFDIAWIYVLAMFFSR